MLTAYGQLGFILIAPLLPTLTSCISYRKLITAASLLMCAGCMARSVSAYSSYSTIFAHVAQVLNGLAGPILASTSTAISAVWFSPHQRTLATSIAVSAGFAGINLILLFAFGVLLQITHTHTHTLTQAA